MSKFFNKTLKVFLLVTFALSMFSTVKNASAQEEQIESRSSTKIKNQQSTEEIVRAVQSGNKKSLNELIKIAEAGDPEAQTELGLFYHQGRVVSENHKKSIEWWTKAAKQDHAQAQYYLGFWYYRNKDFEEAFKFFLEAAKEHLYAKFYLAVLYFNGLGVKERNIDEAIKWMKEASNLNHTAAPSYLKFFEVSKSAEAGDVYFQIQLAEMYFHGHAFAVDQDINKAIEWARKAAEQGYLGAQEKLEEYTKAQPEILQQAEEQNKEEFENIKSFAEEGNSDAQLRLAEKYFEGEGVSQDIDEAIKWAQKAVENGNPYAKKTLESYKDTKSNFELRVSSCASVVSTNFSKTDF